MRPLTADTMRLCDLPLSALTISVSPTLTTTSRSSVTVKKLLDTADTRPPLARPASTSSDTLMILPTVGIKPSKPVLKVTVRVSNCSDFNAHNPARCACPCDVQPTIDKSSTLTPYLAIAASSRTNSYSVLNFCSGLSHATFAIV